MLLVVTSRYSASAVRWMLLYRHESPRLSAFYYPPQAPVPLVWGFRRARRARPLPPAYVLMYHCERKVPLDRSYLRISLEHKCVARLTQSHATCPSAWAGHCLCTTTLMRGWCRGLAL